MKINKVTLSLLALSMSATAFAGHPGDEAMLPAAVAGVNLTAPQQAGSWSFGVEALYWQAGNQDFTYAQVGSVDNDDPDENVNNFQNATIDSDYDWGFKVDATYHFAGNGRDVTLSYTHLETDTDDSVTPATVGAVGDVFPNAATSRNFADVSLGQAWDNAQASSENEYDSVDLTFGQKIQVGQRVYLHPFAGLRWADLDSHDKVNYVDEIINTTTGINSSQQLNVKLRSSFEGIGPRFGTDAQVNINQAWSIRGRVGVSLLVGDTDSSAKVVGTEFSISSPTTIASQTTQNFRADSETRVVPEADARLGVNWGTQINNGTGINFEVGYEVTNYFDALESTFSPSDDFALFGPYLRFQVDLA